MIDRRLKTIIVIYLWAALVEDTVLFVMAWLAPDIWFRLLHAGVPAGGGCRPVISVQVYGEDILNSQDESQVSTLRASAADLEEIGKDVGEIPDIQQELRASDADRKVRERVAHQDQIAGSRVVFRVT